MNLRSLFLLLLLLPIMKLSAQESNPIERLMQEIIQDVDSSQHIANHPAGLKIIAYGEVALPVLLEHFADERPVPIYSDCLKRTINQAELAMILADQTIRMPYFLLTRMQNCLFEFCPNNDNLIEYYFDVVARDRAQFIQRYTMWMEDMMTEKGE
ncbi:MAG: hypothetical protein AAFQ68_14020 [Bacteroidota bacterium]